MPRLAVLLEAARAFGLALLSAAKRFWVHNCFNDCAAISFYAMLSIVPFVGLATAVVTRLIGQPASAIGTQLQRAGVVMPEFAPQLDAAVDTMMRQSTSIGIVSLVVAIWFSGLVFSSVQTAFDRIFHTTHPPIWGTIKPRLVALGAAVLLILGFFFNTAMSLLRSVDQPTATRAITFVDNLPYRALLSSFLLDALVFMVILYALPPLKTRPRSIIVSSLVGTLGWRAARVGFGYYLGYATSQITFTGSAAAALIFMLWIYYAAFVLLFSAELLAALDRSRRELQNAPMPAI